MRKKLILLIGCFLLNQVVLADSKSDTERLFNWAELNFPAQFSIAATTIEVELPESFGELAGNLRYREYPGKIYVGVVNGKNVYVLGGPWPQLTYIDTLPNLITLLPLEPNSTIPGNENCVVRSVFPARGTEYNLQIANAGFIINEQTFFTESTATSSAFTLTIDGGTPTQTEINIRVENGYVYQSDNTINTNIAGISIETITIFSPEQQKIASPACEGQSIKYNYTSASETKISGIVQNSTVSVNVSETQLIEAINENKVVPAGVFNTVRERITNNSDNSYSLLWVDISTAVIVAQENYTAEGVLQVSSELIQLTMP